MYTLLGSGQSRTFRILWMLEELGESFDWLPEAPHSEKVREHSNLGKLPVLLVDGTPLTDSVAIMTYLADSHDRFTAAPGTLERAFQDSLTNQILDEIEGAVWTSAKHSFVLPEKIRVPEIKPVCQKEFARSTAKLAERARGGYLTGDTPTVPDFLLTHCLNWARTAKFPDAPEALVAIGERMRARPAFQATVARLKG
ncbi:glutathione S-transferase [Oceanicola sp. 22II-s10i]|uniref:glutathione S-transferase family protein n=1 Tax=Oceanicola sp. 22II-s10i TaxID=1317116 RepID=UPI000B528199|nr:glutathione S-transferase family protein [Oceanicola sp. 22II-s10i]OWU86133.1 glutathione S-transferase [Oceanicola sp. 22II-s10i]